MLSPKFLRFVAARCLRSASGACPAAAAELGVMAADLECWAKEAETENIALLQGPYGPLFQ
jgi:hypothetical protein